MEQKTYRRGRFHQTSVMNEDFDKYPFVNEIDGKKVKPLSYCFGMCERYVVMCFWCEEIGGEVIE